MTSISPFYKIKCLIGGETGVGKSSLLGLLHEKEHEPKEPTIGMAFKMLKYNLEEFPLTGKVPDFYMKVKRELGLQKNEQIVSANFWDCAGQMRFRNITTSYFRDLDIAFLVFDLTNRDSFVALDKWRSEILNHSDPMFVLIGCKSDMRGWEVNAREIKDKADSWGAKYYILSCVQANSVSMVRRAFYVSVRDVHQKYNEAALRGEELPEHVKEDRYIANRVVEYIQIGDETTPKTGFCCYY